MTLFRPSGLDPHPYLPPSTTGNLKKECGAFVDMIHTSRLIPGEKQNMGHVDIAGKITWLDILKQILD